MIGAVINESLRLFTVLPFIPKYIPDGTSQAFNVADRTLTLPPGTLVFINTSALHYRPKYWTQTGREALSGDSRIPSRRTPGPALAPVMLSLSRDQPGCSGHKKALSYPFSDGSRGCLGKNFALVELCCVVTRIFKDYTVELALDGTSEEQYDDIQRTQCLKKARKMVEHQLSADVGFKMSLRLVGTVPLNLVKRGKETFKDI